MKESDSRAAVLAAVDEARLDLEAAAEREHRARLAYEKALAAAMAAIGVTAVSGECEMSRPAVHAIVRRVASRALRLRPIP
ncbi:MAG TPA: hypothetical protein VFC16_04750 [Nakamurella sp.]|nr:hypothetical protein [Nakamurella sp.]